MERTIYAVLRVLLLLLIMFLLTGVPPFTRYAFAVAPPLLRLGISLSGNYLILTLEKGDTIINKESGITISLLPGTYLLENWGSGIQISDASGNNYGTFDGPLQLVPAQGFFTIGNGRYGSSYRGLLEISRGPDSALVAVNTVDMESYLRGVVPREMPSSWGNYGGIEALKAQAVASRSYALYYIAEGRHKDTPYELCDGQHCQVYGGKSAETTNTDRAVADTQGFILTWKGKVIAPYYHSTNGGYTECPANVWSVTLPYLRSEPDPFDDPQNPLNVRHQAAFWEKDVPLNVLNSLLSGRGVPVSVESVKIASVFPSGRVNELCISGGGHTVSFLKERSRTLLGLRSQLFQVRETPEPRVWIAAATAEGREIKETYSELEGKWAIRAHGLKQMLIGEKFTAVNAGGRDTVPYIAYIFKGRGWGHGIGMSQYGAYNRARSGHLYSEILSFYYPGAQLINAY